MSRCYTACCATYCPTSSRQIELVEYGFYSGVAPTPVCPVYIHKLLVSACPRLKVENRLEIRVHAENNARLR